MTTLDWLIVALPLLAVCYISWRVQRYVRGVSDFLTGGRVAGRYIVAVASGEASMGLIGVVALLEMYFQSGFAIGFWSMLATPVGLLVTLTGFGIYRYRETRAMTMAQFFEVRYSRRFRVFAGLLAWVSGVINYALFPAVGGRFLMYFCELPETIVVAGWPLPTFGLLMATFLSAAVLIVLVGGQLTTMVSDCIGGLFSYACYAAVIVAILAIFSWDQVSDAMLARPPGESMLDPFDTQKLTEFNILFVVIGIIGSVYNRLSWQGTQAYNAAAISPHEQKMGGILSTWRTGYSMLMVIVVAAAGFTFMNHPDFADGAAAVRGELAARIDLASAAATEQVRSQMTVPVAVRHFLPIGVVGAFCAMMVFHLIATDTTYLHSWGSIFVQDVVLPLRRRPFTPAQQMNLLRLSIAGVATFAFFFSLYFNQVTYILMFFALTGAVYLGGAGAVILGGLYWSRGTAPGAWAAMILGSSLAVAGFVCTQFWAGSIHPWLLAYTPGALGAGSAWIERLGDALPFVQWRVTPERFPLSGQEVYLLTMVLASTAYIAVSLATCREPFNLDRMLHRGAYRREDDRSPIVAPALGQGWKRVVLGFDDQFTRGDRALSASVFVYSMGLFAVWLAVVAWNTLVGRFSGEAWATYFLVMNVGVGLAVGAVTLVWFTVGGARDLRQLFTRLKTLQRDAHDDGRVIGHANADDVLPPASPAEASRTAEPPAPADTLATGARA